MMRLLMLAALVASTWQHAPSCVHVDEIPTYAGIGQVMSLALAPNVALLWYGIREGTRRQQQRMLSCDLDTAEPLEREAIHFVSRRGGKRRLTDGKQQHV